MANTAYNALITQPKEVPLFSHLPLSKPRLITMLFMLFGMVFSTLSIADNGQNNCKLSFSSLDALPTEVVLGGDVLALSSFTFSSLALAGQYGSEMGGAVLAFRIKTEGRDIAAIRSFQEPGVDKAVRQYYPVCHSGQYFSAEGLKGIRTLEGLLVLEEGAGDRGLPSGLWVFYQKLDL